MNVIHCGPLPAVAGATAHLIPSAPHRNVILNIRGIEASASRSLEPEVLDLLTVGAYVFLADGEVERVAKRDPLAKRWRREFQLHVPVEDPDRWNRARAELSALLEFATDDAWDFAFRPTSRTAQLTLDLSTGGGPEPTCVSLFSGGLDSLTGALRLVDTGERPILSSHWTTAVGRTFKDEVLEGLQARTRGWRFPNATLRTIRAPGSGDAKESTQRSRGVLYLCLGAAVAQQAGLRRLVVPENGVTSLNLAQSAQSLGAMRSRTTHPKAIWLFRALLAALELPVAIETPLSDMTKADVIAEAVARGGEELAHRTVSCGRGRFRRAIQPHCGTCSQCVDRRLAGLAAGWEDDLEETQHQTNLFRDPLPDGEAAMYPEQYLRFALWAAGATPDAIAHEQDVWRATEAAEDPTGEIMRIYTVVQRHGEQIVSAYQQVWEDSFHDFVAGRLPAKSLVGRIGALEHQRAPWQRLADRIAELITPAVRKAFVKAGPTNEDELQRIIDVAQTAARLHLDREYPTVSYGQVGTRPDFSGQTDGEPLEEPDLFVEVKLVRSKASLGNVTDEILADIPKYADRGRKALFLVYDKGGYVADDGSFGARFEAQGSVRVIMLR